MADSELLEGEIVSLVAALNRSDVDRCLNDGFKPTRRRGLKAKLADESVVGEERRLFDPEGMLKTFLVWEIA